jgi:hypothetical protein
MESWSVNNNESPKEIINFDPVIPYYQERMNQFNSQQVSREDYNKYGWLFGVR